MISNLARVIAEIEARLERGHAAAGTLVQNEARRLAPVDTGRLRSSVTWERRSDGVVVGSNVEYAPVQELGSVYQPAQPYLVPALVNKQAELRGVYGGGR